MMCESVTRAKSSTIIIIANDRSDNHMRHRQFVQNHNDPFSVNDELNWRKKLSSSNYQHHHIEDKNQAVLLLLLLRQAHAPHRIIAYRRQRQHQCRSHSHRNRNTSTNWINIRWVKAIRANRRTQQPIHTTQYSDSVHTLTNLDVHFEWNSRIYFSISPKIHSR